MADELSNCGKELSPKRHVYFVQCKGEMEKIIKMLFQALKQKLEF